MTTAIFFPLIMVSTPELHIGLRVLAHEPRCLVSESLPVMPGTARPLPGVNLALPATPCGWRSSASTPNYGVHPSLLPIRLWSHRYQERCRPTRRAGCGGLNSGRSRVADRVV